MYITWGDGGYNIDFGDRVPILDTLPATAADTFTPSAGSYIRIAVPHEKRARIVCSASRGSPVQRVEAAGDRSRTLGLWRSAGRSRRSLPRALPGELFAPSTSQAVLLGASRGGQAVEDLRKRRVQMRFTCFGF